jgi:hypothetical protein
MVDYSFTLWTHLQTPLEVSTIEDRAHTMELEVAQQKRDLTSLPPRECSTTMIAIAAKMKEITTSQAEQQTIVEMITYMDDKALVWFTHLFDMQVVSIPLIEKINKTDLIASLVTIVEFEVDV